VVAIAVTGKTEFLKVLPSGLDSPPGVGAFFCVLTQVDIIYVIGTCNRHREQNPDNRILCAHPSTTSWTRAPGAGKILTSLLTLGRWNSESEITSNVGRAPGCIATAPAFNSSRILLSTSRLQVFPCQK
jgi:hypothetical protein